MTCDCCTPELPPTDELLLFVAAGWVVAVGALLFRMVAVPSVFAVVGLLFPTKEFVMGTALRFCEFDGLCEDMAGAPLLDV